MGTHLQSLKSNLQRVAIMMFRKALQSTLSRQGRRLHNIPKEAVQGDFQVWVGYLRKPPPATTGWDIPFAGVVAGFIIIPSFMWIWGSGPVLRNRMLRREMMVKYIAPQLEIMQCKTEQERRDFVADFCAKAYKEDDDEEEDDDE